jgi:hypothetical protein
VSERDEACYYYKFPGNSTPTNPTNEDFVWYRYDQSNGWIEVTSKFENSGIPSSSANENAIYSLAGFSNYLYRQRSLTTTAESVTINKLDVVKVNDAVSVTEMAGSNGEYSESTYTYGGPWLWGSAADAGVVSSIAGV